VSKFFSAKKFSLFILTLTLFFWAIGGVWILCAEAVSEAEKGPHPYDYVIGSGDILEISVYGEEDLTKEVRVSGSGAITYPLLGRLKVSGLTATELENMLTEKLGARFLLNPQVSVFVKRFSEIFVYGEVRKPGSYPLAGHVTVLEAVTMAEGLTEVANPRNVKIIRSSNGGKKTFKINLNDITKKGEKNKDIVLEPNDVVVVSKSFF